MLVVRASVADAGIVGGTGGRRARGRCGRACADAGIVRQTGGWRARERCGRAQLNFLPFAQVIVVINFIMLDGLEKGRKVKCWSGVSGTSGKDVKWQVEKGKGRGRILTPQSQHSASGQTQRWSGCLWSGSAGGLGKPLNGSKRERKEMGLQFRRTLDVFACSGGCWWSRKSKRTKAVTVVTA
ncbi:hypothetical protein FB451DRAFT_1195494 [Mycena latifolia]|nr:hypothetical protein FB451DRAFT_1195494 [Mycena latifolia]